MIFAAKLNGLTSDCCILPISGECCYQDTQTKLGHYLHVSNLSPVGGTGHLTNNKQRYSEHVQWNGERTVQVKLRN